MKMAKNIEMGTNQNKRLSKMLPLCINRIQTTKNGTKMVTVPKQWAQMNLTTEIRWFWDFRNNWLVLVPENQIEQEKKED